MEITSSIASISAVNLSPILSNIPATAALFSSLLTYNPVGSVLTSLPALIISSIPASTLSTLIGTNWFPTVFAKAFMLALQTSFYLALLTFIAAVLSALRGEKYIHENDKQDEDSEEA